MTTAFPRLRLTKHHGAGNDFLVVLDPADEAPLDPAVVAALCDRHRGVGADGVIRVVAAGGRRGAAGDGSAELTMELCNADGTRAETSGNGLRCLAQAAVDAGLVSPPTFRVRTDAGVRAVDYEGGECGTARAWVDMGRPQLGDEEDPDGLAEGTRALEPVKVARWVDVGNPHLVLVGAGPATVDVAGVGARLGRRRGGANVEFVAVEADGALVLRVWERGVGETLACGSGSVAAAAVSRAAGWTGDRVVVRNPGGDLEVAFDGDAARLGGPVHRVAEVEVDVAALLAAAGP